MSRKMQPEDVQHLRSIWSQAYEGDNRRRFEECGKHLWIQRSTGGELRMSRDGCNLRWCPVCRPRVMCRYYKKCRYLVSCMRPGKAKFVTLTLRSTDQPLADQLTRLKQAFRRLRQMREWRNRAGFGLGTIEITWNRDRQQWHPHLHIIVDSDYIPHNLLMRMWRKASGGSYIVHIKSLRAGQEGYLTKYLVKSPSIPAGKVREFAAGLAGQRQIITFGNPPAYSDEYAGGERWCNVCSVPRLLKCIGLGEQWAVDLAVDLKDQLGRDVVMSVVVNNRPVADTS